MTPSLLLAPAFAGPKERTRHLKAQSLSIPAGLNLPASGLEFGAVANTFLAFFLPYEGHHIQGMPDQTTATFCIENKALLLFYLPFTRERADSWNRCIQPEMHLPAAVLPGA